MEINNVYAFDECSILNLCKIRIPPAYSLWFKNEYFYSKNYQILANFIESLNSKGIPKHKFVPSNFETNSIKHVNKLLTGFHIELLDTLKAEILEQIINFRLYIEKDFQEIQKKNNIEQIKKVFLKNQKELKKESKIPEDDDMNIIAGYVAISSSGNKYIVSEDEHFWGYSDLILREFQIIVINEAECGNYMA